MYDVEAIAAVAQDANRAYCRSLGDFSQPPWEHAPGWQKESIRAGVEAVITNPDISPEEAHKRWMKKKLDNGWEFGHVKDAEEKIHPCLVPYEHLPSSQKAKDFLFISIVKTLKPYMLLVTPPNANSVEFVTREPNSEGV